MSFDDENDENALLDEEFIIEEWEGSSGDDENYSTDVEVESESENEEDNVVPPVNNDPIWVRTPPQFGVAELDFTGNPGVNEDVVKGNEPLHIFELIVTDDLVAHIVGMTNKYAAQQMSKPTFTLSNRTKKWKEVTAEEIRLLIGFILYQGVVWKPTYAHYFTANKLFETPGTRNLMSYNRFVNIDRFLHFVDNEELGDSYAKAAKISPIWDYMNERFQLLYMPKKYVAIDESLVLWKGRLSWKQSILTKRARFGFKMYSVNESDTGYLYRSLLYTGKEFTDELCGEYKYVATKIVNKLMTGLLDEGRTLFVDSWYSSYELGRCMLSRMTDVVGTLRSDRKDLPVQVNKKKKTEKLKKGDRIVFYDQVTNLMVTQWKDKKDVTMMSSCVNDCTVNVIRAGKEKTIPTVVDFYNMNMGGVDRSDQMLTSYEVERKRVKKWYKKMFHHLINQAVFNSQIIHKALGGTLTPLKFREKLIHDIVVKYPPTHVTTPGRHGRGGVNKDTELRLVGRHFPAYADDNSEKGLKKKSRRCVVCTKRGNKRKETRFICPECDVGLCAAPCFRDYHTKKLY